MSTPKQKPETAKELMDRLSTDSDYVARIEAKEQDRLARMAQHIALMQPIIKELKAAGFEYNSLDDLRRSGIRYVAAIPILVKWLPLVNDPGLEESKSVRSSIVRALSVPWAKPAAALPLIAEFLATPDDETIMKWTIANALEVVADDSVFSEIVGLVRNKRHGKAREMLAAALGNMKNPQAIDALIELLNDDEVAGHALIAIRKLKAVKARPYVARFLDHPKAWVRSEARKVLKDLDEKRGK
jgi:HEAT repeat protein